MKKLLLGSSAFLAVMSVVVLAQGPALAAPPDDLDREKAQLRKENADLRDLLRMREENAGLLRRLGQARIEAPAPLPVAQGPRLQAASPARSGETLRAESPPRRVSQTAFESYAADMPAKAPLPMRAAIYDWTGFYVGGNIGYSIGHDRTSQTLSVPVNNILDTPFHDAAIAPRGAVGGVQFGYNWQGGRNWLLGFEADFQAANQIDKACGNIGCITTGGVEQTVTVEHKLEYFGTVRGRLGAVVDNVLFYGTGGAAYGRVLQTAATEVNLPPNGGVFSSNQTAENRFGWVAGAGIEAALWGNWTAKVEYLYMNLGELSPNTYATSFPTAPPTPVTLTTGGTVRDHIVRAGINYRLGGDAPLSAYGAYASASTRDAYAYAPIAPYNWTGFYLGVNAGYGAGVSHSEHDFGGAAGSSTADAVVTPKGFLGGVQIGYNLQAGGNWLVGFEADLQGTNQSDTACTAISCYTQSNTTAGTQGNSALTMQQQIDWFGTVRGRAGFVNNNILFYGTGGVAFAQAKETVKENVTLSTPANFSTSATSTSLTGWTAGGGIEAALAGNWTAKAEYLYIDFGTIKNTFTDGNLVINTAGPLHDHIFRAGVNYRFSGMPDRSWQ